MHLGVESLIKYMPKKLEMKWDKAFLISKNHADFRVSLVLIREMPRNIVKIRSKVKGQTFKSKDSGKINLLAC